MRIAPPIRLTPEQQEALEQCARARSLSVRLVERARIVLLAAAGNQDKDVAAELRITAQKAARWRKRFLALGMAGLEKDAPAGKGYAGSLLCCEACGYRESAAHRPTEHRWTDRRVSP